MRRKIAVEIVGTVSGYADEGETDAAARGRIAFEAERRVNDIGDIRAHFSLAGETPATPLPASPDSTPRNDSLRAFLKRLLPEGGFGMDALTVWNCLPDDFTEEEVKDTLERMEGDGEVSSRGDLGTRCYYLPKK